MFLRLISRCFLPKYAPDVASKYIDQPVRIIVSVDIFRHTTFYLYTYHLFKSSKTFLKCPINFWSRGTKLNHVFSNNSMQISIMDTMTIFWMILMVHLDTNIDRLYSQQLFVQASLAEDKKNRYCSHFKSVFSLTQVKLKKKKQKNINKGNKQ